MSSRQLPDWVLERLTRWLSNDPSVQVIEAALEWRPKLPAIALVALLGMLSAGAVWIHRSRRFELATPWRATLATLRLAVVAVPILMLLQPVLLAHMERTQPRTLAFLVDGSGSMSVRDGEGSVPASRWQQAMEARPALLDAVTERGTSVAPGGGRAGAGLPRTEFHVFNDHLRFSDPTTFGQHLERDQEVAAQLPSGQTAIGVALRQIQGELAGRPGSAVVLLSDGGDNASDTDRRPVHVARALGLTGIPVHTCLVGNERPRNISVNVMAEAPVAFAGDPIPLRVRIEHTGFDETVVTVLLQESDRTLETREVILPAGGEPATERFDVRFDETGSRRCRVEILAVPGELTTADNVSIADVEIIDEPLRVLYIERWPRWQYRFLRNAFQRDERLQVQLVLLTEDPATPEEERQTTSFPATQEELQTFDAIIVGDLARQDLTLQQWQWLYDHVVENGAGIIFIAGPAHMPADFLEPPLEDLLPFQHLVTVSEDDLPPWRPVVTPLGFDHPLMRFALSSSPGAGRDARSTDAVWSALPALQWYAGLSELKPGALVLAERPGEAGAESTPLLVLQRAGRGVSLFVGTDETWKWRYEVGNRYFYSFWAQAIQHVGMPHRLRQFRTVRIETASGVVAPRVPTGVTVALQGEEAALMAGESPTLTMIAQAREGTPSAIQSAWGPQAGGPPMSFTLRRSADSAFLYHGHVELAAEGVYGLYLEGYEDRGEARLEVSSAGVTDLELAHPVVNRALLRQIAQASGGEHVTLEQLPELLARMDLDPLRYRWSETIVLWDGWTLLLILAVLLAAEWTIRKWKYLP